MTLLENKRGGGGISEREIEFFLRISETSPRGERKDISSGLAIYDWMHSPVHGKNMKVFTLANLLDGHFACRIQFPEKFKGRW